MTDLELLVKKERPRVWAFCDMGKPFDYIRNVNDEYFCGSFELKSSNKVKGVFDMALDDYSYLKRNNVVNAKQESLLRTFKAMYKVVDEYKRGFDILESEE